MKTQISRLSHRAGQRYSGVFQQQGRMITDADLNEMVQVLQSAGYMQGRLALDGGAPADRGLVDIDDDNRPTLKWGRVVADGMVGEVAPEAGYEGKFDYRRQADFPGAPPLPVEGGYVMYADLWQRVVTALEDPELRDAGLLGADTCTRTRTMAQLKWARSEADVENPDRNPRKGNAGLALRLREVVVGADLCDPCGTDETLDEPVGDYLFRVEVHAVQRDADGNLAGVTLKWSRENGAEQHEALRADDLGGPVPVELPQEFTTGHWAYEFHDLETETHLGAHLVDRDAQPGHGRLQTTPALPGEGKPRRWVRRWDGYCTVYFNGGSPSAVKGWDKNQQLVRPGETDSIETHGRYRVEAGDGGDRLRISLDRMDLFLEASGKAFVAGDYWLAPVRDRQHAAGSWVLGDRDHGESPIGVEHHYLPLARFNGAGLSNPEPLSDARRRRLSMPALSDLPADHVGYNAQIDVQVESRWHDIIENYNDAALPENAQQAFDLLVKYLNAQDLVFPAPCSGDGNSVYRRLGMQGPSNRVQTALQKLLCELDAAALPYNPRRVPAVAARWKDIRESGNDALLPGTVQDALDVLVRYLDPGDLSVNISCANVPDSPFRRLGLSGNAVTVATALKKLLCELKADHIPVNPKGPCADLGDARTVQEALNVLCERPAGGGCAVTVGRGGQFPTIPAALTALKAAEDVWLCLLPGEHALAGLNHTGDGLLRISGAGAAASVIVATAHLRIDVGELALKDVGIRFSAGRYLDVTAASVDVTGCDFYRRDSVSNNYSVNTSGMARIRAASESETTRVFWVGNTMSLPWRSTHPQYRFDRVAFERYFPKEELPREIHADIDAIERILDETDPWGDPRDFADAVTRTEEIIQGWNRVNVTIGEKTQTPLNWVLESQVEAMRNGSLANKVTAPMPVVRSAGALTVARALPDGALKHEAVSGYEILASAAAKTDLKFAAGERGPVTVDPVDVNVYLDIWPGVIGNLYKSGYGTCLQLMGANVGGVVRDNRMLGVLRLQSDVNALYLIQKSTWSYKAAQEVVRQVPAASKLTVANNDMNRILAYANREQYLARGNTPRVLAHQAMDVHGNVIAEKNSSVAANGASFSNNKFTGALADADVAIFVLRDYATWTGNFSPGHAYAYNRGANASREAANLMNIAG